MKVEVVLTKDDWQLCTVVPGNHEALPHPGDCVRRASDWTEWVIEDVDGPTALSNGHEVVGCLVGIFLPTEPTVSVDDELAIVRRR